MFVASDSLLSLCAEEDFQAWAALEEEHGAGTALHPLLRKLQKVCSFLPPTLSSLAPFSDDLRDAASQQGNFSSNCRRCRLMGDVVLLAQRCLRLALLASLCPLENYLWLTFRLRSLAQRQAHRQALHGTGDEGAGRPATAAGG